MLWKNRRIILSPREFYEADSGNVEVRNTDTNVPCPTVTTDTGAYSVLQLPPGPYRVTVRASGFKTLVRTGLTVAAGQVLPLDLTLEVGAATESVTVSAEATLLKTETGDGTFTWSKSRVAIRPNLFVPSTKSLESTDQPFVGQLYQLPRTGTLIARFSF